MEHDEVCQEHDVRLTAEGCYACWVQRDEGWTLSPTAIGWPNDAT